MSRVLIQAYHRDLESLKVRARTRKETSLRDAFAGLLRAWGKPHDLALVPEYGFKTKTGENRSVDGALVNALRLPIGYWEAKDEDDDLDKEIALKFARGYPQDNIVFEDTTQAVLYQGGQEVARCATNDSTALENLLTRFFAYERQEVADFRKAVIQFAQDLPSVLEALRGMIDAAKQGNPQFAKASAAFLDHIRGAINPTLTHDDVREILIQHILTEDLFSALFTADFHKDNNIARELYALERTFFTGNTRFQTLKRLESYYAAIRAAAAAISAHHEKQAFLKSLYENFYKAYNPGAADRLGVIYTPNEIVRFMIEGADYLCEKHFGKILADKGVEILDPATGTGTFVCEMLQYFSGQPAKMRQKYKEELHANEIGILPYYIAK